jgi:hypothetical protein
MQGRCHAPVVRTDILAWIHLYDQCLAPVVGTHLLTLIETGDLPMVLRAKLVLLEVTVGNLTWHQLCAVKERTVSVLLLSALIAKPVKIAAVRMKHLQCVNQARTAMLSILMRGVLIVRLGWLVQ